MTKRADLEGTPPDLLSDLLSFTESRRDLGLDVSGAPLLGDNIGQQIDEHLVVLQQRHRAVLRVKCQICPERPNAHMDLTWVLTLARLQSKKKSRPSTTRNLRKK